MSERPTPALVVAALGVVFGDIGTSPIYAFRESLHAAGHAGSDAEAVLGILSLLFWTVTLVVTVKYVLGVMRADYEGEGGIMALLALALAAPGRHPRLLLVTGLAGAALFLGDAMITPAISVLSAVEGTQIALPGLRELVVPIAAGMLLALFAFQYRGSSRVGAWFGPVMALWFVVIAAAGVVALQAHPAILWALAPVHAVRFALHARPMALLDVLGAVFLAVTGAEALYADMSHFGRSPIRLGWFFIAMPALLLNYLGQGAMVLAQPQAGADPFFHLFGGWTLLPVVALATAATVIASQAVISGAFALAQQAIHLGALPRLEVRQTSAATAGQVYLPVINWLLAACVLGLVFSFRTSSHLSSAYGIAVSGNMLATSILVASVALSKWRLPRNAVLPVAGLFLLMDLVFVAANLHKVLDGGWFPLTAGAMLMTLMLVWKRGRTAALARHGAEAPPVAIFIARLAGPEAPIRHAGVAIYLTADCDHAPEALTLNTRHNGTVHASVILLQVLHPRTPRVAEHDRLQVTRLEAGFHKVRLHFGFAEHPDLPAVLEAHKDSIGCDFANASFFISRENPVHAQNCGLPLWQERVYAFLSRNAVSATDYFNIPNDKVIELGSRVAI